MTRANQLPKKKFIFFIIFLSLFLINLNLIYTALFTEHSSTSIQSPIFPVISEFDNNSLKFDWLQVWGEGATYTDPLGYTRSHYGHDIAIDSQDNIYFVGETSQGNGRKNDFCVVKYDSEGNELWNQTWGGSRYDSAMGVAVDSNDNVYVAGTYHQYFYDQPEGGDFAVIKYNTSGSKIWERTYGGSNDDECRGIAIDSNDNIYLVGTRDMSPNEVFMVVKYNSAGTFQWYRTFGGSFPDICSDVAVDAFNNIYLVGRTNSFGAGFNFLLVKYNPSGTKLWHQVWDPDVFSDDHGGEITIDSSNNVYIVGFSDDGSGPRQVSLVKYTSSGSYQWARMWSGGNYAKDDWYDCGAITTGLDDNIYVTSLQKNLWVYNSDGDLEGTLDYYASDMGTPSAMAFDSLGNLYIGGKKETSYHYYKLSLVRYKIRTPIIDILSPTPNSLFGKKPPDFELSIYEPDLNTTWYNLNNGLNYTFSGLTNTIDQSAWDACANGTVTMRFFANNSDEDTSSKDVTVRKDSIDPEVSIESPEHNELFGNAAPGFNVTINEPNLEVKWYSLNNGVNTTFSGSLGTFDQGAWDACGNGTVLIRFYANDSGGNSNFDEIVVRKNAHIPEITILEPNPSDLFADNPPTFELSIVEPDLNETWYALNGGSANFFSGFIGAIDQSAWDVCDNGTVTIRFYVNNTVGNYAYEEVQVFKDIFSPEIVIESPDPYELFGNGTIGYDLTITEPHLNTTWYSLNNGENYTFSAASGLIDQGAWDACGNGTVLIRFYANDTMGHFTMEEVTVRKDSIKPVWDTAPQDQIIEFGQDLSYQLDASDPSGIANWWINDTSVFSISGSGLLTNNIALDVYEHHLKISAFDPVGNFCNATIQITIQDTTDPTWNVLPIDQFVEFGNGLDYQVGASDLSGIDLWWINDTSPFNISQSGLIYNTTELSIGINWIEIRAYDPYNHFCEAHLMINVSDTIAPTWDEVPLDQYVEFGEDFSYSLSASDLSGIDHWWIDDDSIFNITSEGLISNSSPLSVGIYWIEIRAYDPYSQYCEVTIMINVSDTIKPTWDEIPTNQHIMVGEDVSYKVNASDLSGIDHCWISDTSNFSITTQGFITNHPAISAGTYILEIRAYDPYGNYCSATITIVVNQPASTQSIPGFDIITLIGICSIITIILVKKKRGRIS